MVNLIVSDFGTVNNETVHRFTWESTAGVLLSAISYGVIIQSIKVPDQNGDLADIVLGFDDLDGYVNRNTPYFGAAIGRCANRIGGANFSIDGEKYELAQNIPPNHLHGGNVGFDKKVWKTTVDGNKVIFSYLSKDCEENYPGDLLVNIIYELTDDNVFHMHFRATTSKKTVINLTNHSYFNLAGHQTGAEELYNHIVNINANRITETDSDSIPTGRLLNVAGTYFDLRNPTKIGDAKLKSDNLFDNNFCVNKFGNEGLTFAAHVSHPESGRYLEVHTNKPGVQFYTSNGLPTPSEPALVGKDGVGYRRHGAFCLETQDYPDAVHHPNFPSVILTPGDVYDHNVLYTFGVQK